MKKKGLLLASISMVLVAVLALTTASFAWFTASMNPSVEVFDVNVTTGKSLLVSATETAGFKTIVTKDDLVKVTTNNLIQAGTGADKAKMNAASPFTLTGNAGEKLITVAGNAIKFAKPKPLSLQTDIWSKTGTDAEKYGYTETLFAEDAASTEFYFVKFDLYFKSSAADEAKDITVSLDLGTKSDTAKQGDGYDGTDFYGIAKSGDAARLDPLTTFQGQIAKVLRVAFVPDVTTTSGTAPSVNATKIDTNPDAIVYEPNSTALDSTGMATPAAPVIDEEHVAKPTESMAIPKTGLVTCNITGKSLFTLKANKTAKMTVYIWIEGNDPDCVNEVSSAFFRSNLKFKGVDVVTPAP